MRLLVFTFLLLPVFAQQQPAPEGGRRQPPPPKNLKLLEPAQVMPYMRAFRVALGVQCTHCHVQGDFASDANPKKEIARNMIVMTREINAKFPDGKMHVSCFTCHRGSTEPATAPPAGANNAAPPPPPPPAPPPPPQQ
jgi:hypothetical protein